MAIDIYVLFFMDLHISNCFYLGSIRFMFLQESCRDCSVMVSKVVVGSFALEVSGCLVDRFLKHELCWWMSHTIHLRMCNWDKG